MEYFATNAKDKMVKQLAGLYPIPMEPWGESSQDVAMIEALMQIQGKTLLTFVPESSNAHKTINLQPVGKSFSGMTRASENAPIIDIPVRKGGATLTEQERIAFDSQAYK